MFTPPFPRGMYGDIPIENSIKKHNKSIYLWQTAN